MIPSVLTGPAGRRLLGAVGLAFLVSACAEVAALIGPGALTALVESDWRLWSGNAWAATPRDRWVFALAGYNGGGVVTGAERAACAGSRGCNPARYFDNVERFCGANGRSAASCRENRQYPRVILEFWTPAYHRWLQG